MKKLFLLAAAAAVVLVSGAQELPVKWEELTAPQFRAAVDKSQGVCVIPTGVIEKHGPHLPLGTDVYQSRYITEQALSQEYAVMFPYYFAGVINEAKHQPGTIAYSPEMICKLLEETCAEIARNGLKKIIIHNIHGGNPTWLQFFVRSQLATPRDYAVFYLNPSIDAETQKKMASVRKMEKDNHAGERETSKMLVIAPNLVDMSKAGDEPFDEQKRIDLKNLNTGISWYSRFPNHYGGDGGVATQEYGRVMLDQQIAQLIEVVRRVKADTTTLPLLRQFYEQSQNPLATPVFK